MKKIFAFLLVVIMLLGLVPAVAFAEPPTQGDWPPRRQRPVTVSEIQVGTSTPGSNNYNLNIRWERPALSTISDVRGGVTWSDVQPLLPNNNIWTVFPFRYDIQFRNATAGHGFNENPALPLISHSPTVPGENGQARNRPAALRWENFTGMRSFTMEPASLYEIYIEAVRNTPARRPIPGMPGTFYVVGEPATPDLAPPAPGGLLFLTDITPTGAGRGNTITVTWQNPTFDGQNIFQYWRIGWQELTPNMTLGGYGFGEAMRVGGTDAPPSQIRQNADGTLTATISPHNLPSIGQVSVVVEPLLGPNPALPANQVRGFFPNWRPYSAPVLIGGRTYTIYFTENPYRTTVTMIPELFIEQLGAEHIRLWWPVLAHISQLDRVELQEWPPALEGTVPTSDDGMIRVLARRGRETFIHINDYIIGPGLPRDRRAFSLKLIMEDGSEVWTEIVVFDPLVADFSPYRPEIMRLNHATVSDVGGFISMEWLAFARFPTVPAEEAWVPDDPRYMGRFVDLNVYYEIFVSDTWEELNRLTEPLMTLHTNDLQRGWMFSHLDPNPPHNPVEDPTWMFAPGQYITQYQHVGGLRDITGNRVYFVRIRAVRDPGGQSSNWAFGSVYVPPLRPLEITPEMISSPPVRVADERATAIDIEWDIRFLEILRQRTSPQAIDIDPPGGDTSPPLRNTWYPVIGVDRNNNLIFGRSAAHINYVLDADGELVTPPGSPARHRILNDILNNDSLVPTNLRNRLLGLQDPIVRFNPNDPRQVGEFLGHARPAVEAELTRLGFALGENDRPITLRIQDTQTPLPFSYEIHVVPYATVRSFVLPGVGEGFTAYRTFINSNPAGIWASIGQPPVSNGVASHSVTGLSVNTPYIIFVRPYVTIGGRQIRAAYPTFVVGTTVDDPYRPVPDPTTPVLIPVPEYTRRDRVAVRWRVQSDMIYELRISHFFSDYPDRGISIPLSFEDVTNVLDGRTVELEEPRAIFFMREVEGIPYFFLRIYERFPGTQYYIWARAASVDAVGAVSSEWSQWSNPVDIRTNDIEPPPPPRSFARAPQGLLNTFNRYNDTEYQSDEPYALTLSWMRILADLRDDDGNLRERAEAGTGDANIRPLNLPNIGATPAYAALHLLRFEELRANQRFYARARTFLTVQRDGPDIYSYEIELADNPDFLDSVTYTIPPLPAFDAINMRRANSDWVYLETQTGVTADEFDGVHRPDQYPLPERDWEITYDRGSQTLTWRFRTNQRGADGRLDQNVDQRFITRLIQSRTFVYTIDISSYGEMPIANREVIVPESILRAFSERQITLEILAGEHNVQIPPGAFDTAQTRGLQPGIGSYYTIALNAVMSGMPPLTTNTEFATVPQRFGVSLETPMRHATALTTFARPVNIDLPVEDHIAPEGLRTGLFILDVNTAAWRDVQGDFNFATETLRSTIQAPTTFAGISRNAPPVETPADRANAPMSRVTAHLNITDLTRFNAADEVTPTQFNNLVNVIAQGERTVTMNANLPAAAAQSMTRARIFAPPDFTREVALDILVRLYETRTRQILTPMTPVESVPGMQNADPALHRNLRLAADLGFITGPIEPDGALTMGEMMNILDIIIQDAR
ncbi:MAG: hypothetical protein FWF77_06935 [Defluviitaleaceae bacterium]|nr:hypothetical protein [Defluviitaleaceae bacterium]